MSDLPSVDLLEFFTSANPQSIKSYNAEVASLLDSIPAAILLHEFIKLSREPFTRFSDIKGAGKGWFYENAEILRQRLAFTKINYGRAQKKLKNHGLLDDFWIAPNKYFRLNLKGIKSFVIRLMSYQKQTMYKQFKLELKR